MHPHLEILLQLQDLKAQRRELAEGGEVRRVEEEEFHVDLQEAIAKLDAKIEEMEAELPPDVRRRYRQIEGRGRAVVPVINGICYGCFVSIPTAVVAEIERNDAIRLCDHCGRILYGLR
ncbi:MAG TPA: C4-type zinc ribbon domain-containing protein [Longimicrobiales bacterium]